MFNPLGNGRPRPARFIVSAGAVGFGVALFATYASAHAIQTHSNVLQARRARPDSYSQPLADLAQDSDDDADSGVPPDQVEKYIAVYKDMQRDRSLTVAAAAAKEGFTVAEFRELEQKIERDEDARDHVRTELQGAVGDQP
jgi:hypothetical protein